MLACCCTWMTHQECMESVDDDSRHPKKKLPSCFFICSHLRESPISQHSWFTITMKPSHCFSTGLLCHLCEHVRWVYERACVQARMDVRVTHSLLYARTNKKGGKPWLQKKKKNLISINPAARLEEQRFLRVTACRFRLFVGCMTQACTWQTQ